MMFSGGGEDVESFSEGMAMPDGIPIQMSLAAGEDGGGGASLSRRGKEERFPQWGQQETRDLIAIRADLERDPSAARTLWEAVAAKMRDRGYRRTPDQCKSKWKSLVNRYKGKETADPGAAGRQWPFFDELSVVFMERKKDMHRRLLESESGSSQRKKKPKTLSGIRSSEESGSEDEDEYDSDDEQQHIPKSRKKAFDSRGVASIQELLREFLQQQHLMELQRCEMMKQRVQARQAWELERQQSMEKLEREKLMLEQAWREEEEDRGEPS